MLCHYAECLVSFIIILLNVILLSVFIRNVILLSVFILSAVMLGVVMLSTQGTLTEGEGSERLTPS